MIFLKSENGIKNLTFLEGQFKGVKVDFDASEELFLPSPVHSDANYGPGFDLPGEVHYRLFEYQRTCIRWLWELYSQEVGGIVGDEMGLGKTIQIIAFIAGLSHSRKLKGPVLIVCPATVMKQWVQEFHEWWPPLRVAVLHSSGSGMSQAQMSSKRKYDRESLYASSDSEKEENSKSNKSKREYKSNPAIKRFVSFMSENGHVVITTYEGLRVHRADLLPIKWAYAVLDEGHKIRNPDAEITITAKQLRTHNRIILSGTPIQNNLTELWSLYDFVFPGRLGTLPVFQSEFSIPISLGGY
jgi:DNA excision repair protein ERCC-6